MLGNTSDLEATCADGKPASLQRMPDNSKMQSWSRTTAQRALTGNRSRLRQQNTYRRQTRNIYEECHQARVCPRRRLSISINAQKRLHSTNDTSTLLTQNVSNIASFGWCNFLRLGSKTGSGHLVAGPLVMSD